MGVCALVKATAAVINKIVTDVMTQLRLATKDFDKDNLPFRDAHHLNITRENINDLREFSKRMQEKLNNQAVNLKMRTKWADQHDDSESEAVEAASA